MTVKAEIALVQEGNRLVYGGIGYQPEADFNRGDRIGEYVDHSSNESGIQVKTDEGKTLRVKHGDYYDE